MGKDGGSVGKRRRGIGNRIMLTGVSGYENGNKKMEVKFGT